MVGKKLTLATALVVAGLAGSSQAATVLSSGSQVDGWSISFPVGISLVSDGGPTLTLEKGAAFTNIEGLVITFTQVSYNASPTIDITDETVTNVSGQDWSGFQFIAANTLTGNAGAATLEPNAFNNSTPPFTTQTDSPSTITLGGGVQPNLATADWGFGSSGGDLVIDANPATSGVKKVFDFKEIPVTSVIPLPAAGWMGLTGLVGLGLISSAKRMRKILA
jgi:hypothetical protein